jgi:hypothetical protein
VSLFNFAFPWIPSASPVGRPEPFPGYLAPTIVTYAGDRAIEERIVTEVASFGRQLGILTAALLEVADGEPGKAVERLRAVANRVETVKGQFRRALEDNAEDAFMALLDADPAAAARLVDAFERRVALHAAPAEETGPAA